jgi:hypothetical protein
MFPCSDALNSLTLFTLRNKCEGAIINKKQNKCNGAFFKDYLVVGQNRQRAHSLFALPQDIIQSPKA